MSVDNDNTASAPLFIEFRPGMRKALADAVEAFLNLLDQIDGDADLRGRQPAPRRRALRGRWRRRAELGERGKPRCRHSAITYGRKGLTTIGK